MQTRRARLVAAMVAIVAIVAVAGVALVARPWDSKPACPAASRPP